MSSCNSTLRGRRGMISCPGVIPCWIPIRISLVYRLVRGGVTGTSAWKRNERSKSIRVQKGQGGEERWRISGSKNDDVGVNPDGHDWVDTLYGNDDLSGFGVSSGLPMCPQDVTSKKYRPFNPFYISPLPVDTTRFGDKCRGRYGCSPEASEKEIAARNRTSMEGWFNQKGAEVKLEGRWIGVWGQRIKGGVVPGRSNFPEDEGRVYFGRFEVKFAGRIDEVQSDQLLMDGTPEWVQKNRVGSIYGSGGTRQQVVQHWGLCVVIVVLLVGAW